MQPFTDARRETNRDEAQVLVSADTTDGPNVSSSEGYKKYSNEPKIN